MDSAEEERDASSAQGANKESSADPSAPEAPSAQESPQGSDAASPQTDSPVMVNADVCLFLDLFYRSLMLLPSMISPFFKQFYMLVRVSSQRPITLCSDCCYGGTVNVYCVICGTK